METAQKFESSEFSAATSQAFLRNEFARRVRLNPRYSLRAFARMLDLSSGALSEVLSGRRLLSLKTARRVGRALDLSPIELEQLYQLVESDRMRSHTRALGPIAEQVDPDQRRLDEDTFHLVSEWHHFAILNLFDCEGFRWDAKHISRRLGISAAEAQLSMHLLLRLGLVEKNGATLRAAKNVVVSPAGVPSSAVRRYHRDILAKASDALELQGLENREISGIGFAIDPSVVPQIKREIALFQNHLIDKYAKGKRREVYFFESALFRLTQGGGDEQK